MSIKKKHIIPLLLLICLLFLCSCGNKEPEYIATPDTNTSFAASTEDITSISDNARTAISDNKSPTDLSQYGAYAYISTDKDSVITATFSIDRDHSEYDLDTSIIDGIPIPDGIKYSTVFYNDPEHHYDLYCKLEDFAKDEFGVHLWSSAEEADKAFEVIDNADFNIPLKGDMPYVVSANSYVRMTAGDRLYPLQDDTDISLYKYEELSTPDANGNDTTVGDYVGTFTLSNSSEYESNNVYTVDNEHFVFDADPPPTLDHFLMYVENGYVSLGLNKRVPWTSFYKKDNPDNDTYNSILLTAVWPLSIKLKNGYTLEAGSHTVFTVRDLDKVLATDEVLPLMQNSHLWSDQDPLHPLNVLMEEPDVLMNDPEVVRLGGSATISANYTISGDEATLVDQSISYNDLSSPKTEDTNKDKCERPNNKLFSYEKYDIKEGIELIKNAFPDSFALEAKNDGKIVFSSVQYGKCYHTIEDYNSDFEPRETYYDRNGRLYVKIAPKDIYSLPDSCKFKERKIKTGDGDGIRTYAEEDYSYDNTAGKAYCNPVIDEANVQEITKLAECEIDGEKYDLIQVVDTGELIADIPTAENAKFYYINQKTKKCDYFDYSHLDYGHGYGLMLTVTECPKPQKPEWVSKAVEIKSLNDISNDDLSKFFDVVKMGVDTYFNKTNLPNIKFIYDKSESDISDSFIIHDSTGKKLEVTESEYGSIDYDHVEWDSFNEDIKPGNVITKDMVEIDSIPESAWSRRENIRLAADSFFSIDDVIGKKIKKQPDSFKHSVFASDLE